MPGDSSENHHSLGRTPSVNTLKLLGQKIFKGHSSEVAARPHGGSPNAPAKHKAGSPVNSNSAKSPGAKKTASHPSTDLKTSASLSNLVAHNHNPFSSPAAEVLGTGTGVAAPRTPHHTHHVSPRKKSPSFAHTRLKNENIVYNPYGLNSNNARPGTASIDTTKNDINFYMHDGDTNIRMLPLPIADPNDFLPDNMKQFSVQLPDNFVFDNENETLGTGGSSEVRKIRSAYRQKDIYALKKLNMVYHETPEKFYKRCSKEFIIAKHLSHNIHIANTFYLMKVPTTTYTTRGWGFIMEICTGDLFQLMTKTGWSLVPRPEKFCIFKQVARAIKFCHENGIAHRDIKPENVLLSKEGICKLTDFGISDWSHTDPLDYNSPIKQCEGMIGSTPYAPPEVMYFDDKKDYPEELKKPYNPLLMDCYALGVILLTLINNSLPFYESCDADSRFREFQLSYDSFTKYQNKQFRVKGSYKPGPGSEYRLSKNFLSTDATRVAWRLADPVPETRYTIDDLFADPWFVNIETCVDPDDVECNQKLEVRQPELRKATTDSEVIYSDEYDHQKDSTTEGGSHTEVNRSLKPQPLKKPRSMVEIAQFPNLSKQDNLEHEKDPHAAVHEKRVHIKPLFTLNEDQDKEGVQDDEESEATVEENHGQNKAAAESNPIPPSLDKLSINTDKITTPASTVTKPSQPSTASSSPTNARPRHRHVIHHHLDVTNSFKTPTATRSFSDR